MGNGSSIADVHCPKCGAPAEYNIIRGSYKCGFCGSTVELGEAMAEKQGFRKLQQEKIRKSSERYRLMRASCSGCGAEIVFADGKSFSADGVMSGEQENGAVRCFCGCRRGAWP